MRAYEFHANVEDGIIRIPDQYRAQVGSDVKVILLANDALTQEQGHGFSAIKLQTKGFHFAREDANER